MLNLKKLAKKIDDYMKILDDSIFYEERAREPKADREKQNLRDTLAKAVERERKTRLEFKYYRTTFKIIFKRMQQHPRGIDVGRYRQMWEDVRKKVEEDDVEKRT